MGILHHKISEDSIDWENNECISNGESRPNYGLWGAVTPNSDITMHREIPMPVFLIFPVILVDASVNNILVFTLASWVFNSSVKYLKGVEKMTLQFRSQSLIRKQLKSCGTLKIKFGSNFIDNGTPLVIQNFCLNQTMSIILIHKRREAKF